MTSTDGWTTNRSIVAFVYKWSVMTTNILPIVDYWPRPFRVQMTPYLVVLLSDPYFEQLVRISVEGVNHAEWVSELVNEWDIDDSQLAEIPQMQRRVGFELTTGRLAARAMPHQGTVGTTFIRTEGTRRWFRWRPFHELVGHVLCESIVVTVLAILLLTMQLFACKHVVLKKCVWMKTVKNTTSDSRCHILWDEHVWQWPMDFTAMQWLISVSCRICP